MSLPYFRRIFAESYDAVRGVSPQTFAKRSECSVHLVAPGALDRGLGPISDLAIAMPPQRKLAAPAADDGNIHGEDEEPEGDHPKPDHGEKADETAGNKQDADAKADWLRLRQVELAIGEADLLLGHGDLSASRHHIGMAADGRNRAAS
jgi:hypothetical protein